MQREAYAVGSNAACSVLDALQAPLQDIACVRGSVGSAAACSVRLGSVAASSSSVVCSVRYKLCYNV